MKQISCGIVIVNDDRVLGVRAFGRKDNLLDIPKGKRENLERYEDTAIRECFEETGLRLPKKELKDYGVWIYTKEKNLYLFKYNDYRDEINPSTCQCNSYFDYGDKKVPEIIDYEWVFFNEIKNRFYTKLVPILEKIVINY